MEANQFQKDVKSEFVWEFKIGISSRPWGLGLSGYF